MHLFSCIVFPSLALSHSPSHLTSTPHPLAPARPCIHPSRTAQTQWRERAANETDLAEQRKAHMILLRSQLSASIMMTEQPVGAMEKGLDKGRPLEAMLLRDRLYNMLKTVRMCFSR